jgi:hypothetical protein
MEFVENALVVLHFIGLASLLGGFLVQLKSSPRVVNNAMIHGVLTQLVTGLLLVGIAEGDEDVEVNHAKIAVKLVVLLLIGALVLVNRKKDAISTAVWAAIGGLTVANIVIAVFW